MTPNGREESECLNAQKKGMLSTSGPSKLNCGID